jgi:hypothetical protein
MTTLKPEAIFENYRWAIIRLATAFPVAETSSSPLLVFASVEFVHSDRPQPGSTPLAESGFPPHTRGDGPSGLRVYFRQIGLAASDALLWYREVARGEPSVPFPTDERPPGGRDRIALRGPRLTDEPPWPSLSFPISDSSFLGGIKGTYPTPFLGSGASPARVHRLMPAADADLDALSRDPIACDWLAPRIHFRIDSYPELLGAAVVIAPDPQVAAVKQYFTQDGNGTERLVTFVQARANQRISELGLTVFEERFGAISTFQYFAVPESGIVETQPPAEVRASGYMLGHPQRGLVDFQPPTPFIRTVGLTMETSTRRVKVQTRDSNKKDAEIKEHEFPEATLVSDSLIGEADPPPSAQQRFWNAAALRISTDQARKADQRWVDDTVAARAFLRGIISSARNEVFVADCFFNSSDLGNYLHFVRRLSLTINVLTSSWAFEASSDRVGAKLGMAATIESFRQRGIPNIHVRLMPHKDDAPILHDRFLAVDDAVWFSGNSLNGIGQRESLIIKLPDPKSVLDRLNKLFGESVDFTQG